ncbi:MAG: DUF4202 domain-containing protein [Spirochaetaceae bacterium]|nr:DUF4202 domain-containing protein [Spirochaetaceae bacterium]
MADAELIGEALDRIDKAHRQDPAGRALEYARRMTRWLERLAPHPSAALAIAVRAQHLRRWEIPRAGYPEGRSGYLRWRRACARHHADKVGLILDDLCAPAALIERVAALVRKEGLGRDAETQALEDAACLSFLEAELAGFAEGRDPDTLQRVLGRTWEKMSPRARELAASLDVRPPLDEVIGRLRPPSGQ